MRIGHIVAGFFIALFATFFFLYEGGRIWRYSTNNGPDGLANTGDEFDIVREQIVNQGTKVKVKSEAYYIEDNWQVADTFLAYIGLRPHPLSSVTMPSKTQANLAAGKPLLVAATGDVADVARDSGAAFVTEDLRPAAIAATIEAACRPGRAGLRELGAKARSYYEHTFSVDEGVRRIEGLLEAAGSRS